MSAPIPVWPPNMPLIVDPVILPPSRAPIALLPNLACFSLDLACFSLDSAYSPTQFGRRPPLVYLTFAPRHFEFTDDAAIRILPNRLHARARHLAR